MLAEFEEKTYEHYLTLELVCGRQLFAPGQVQESILGFDVALRSSSATFWRQFPPMYPWWRSLFHIPPHGTGLDNRWWQEFQNDVNRFPSFRFNCFIQAKRPHYMKRSGAAEYSSWNKPYFRYDILRHQQKSLAYLARKTAGKAVVTYASPTFHTNQALWGAASSRQCVQESNFCESVKLNDHNRYTYDSPGNAGIAHSDPVPINSVPFEESMERLSKQDPMKSNLAFLTYTGEIIDEAAQNLGPNVGIYKAILSTFSKTADHKLATALARIYAFEFLSNVKLLIGYK